MWSCNQSQSRCSTCRWFRGFPKTLEDYTCHVSGAVDTRSSTSTSSHRQLVLQLSWKKPGSSSGPGRTWTVQAFSCCYGRSFCLFSISLDSGKKPIYTQEMYEHKYEGRPWAKKKRKERRQWEQRSKLRIRNCVICNLGGNFIGSVEDQAIIVALTKNGSVPCRSRLDFFKGRVRRDPSSGLHTMFSLSTLNWMPNRDKPSLRNRGAVSRQMIATYWPLTTYSVQDREPMHKLEACKYKPLFDLVDNSYRYLLVYRSLDFLLPKTWPIS